uniref:Uncharacterized protein n=1 Tax=Lepeophtheirus salmonis TaxID=72036 RepID=A0A0K2UBV6_LEPSM
MFFVARKYIMYNIL